MNDITALSQREKFEAWLEEAEALPWGYLKKRRTSDDAYHEPNTTDMWAAWQAASVEMVEALEKAQKSNQFLKDQLSELANFNPDWDKLEASYESWREIAAELLVAKNRIADLESRTVTVKLPDYRNSPDMHTKQNYGEKKAMTNQFTGMGTDHPANGPLTVERIARLIAELRRSLDNQNGGDMVYVIADAIKGLEELLVSREAEGGWIPVSERMPEREVDVQVYCSDKKEQMVGYMERNEKDGWFRFASLPNGGGVYCKPTHWQPLPAAPKEVK